MQTRKLILQDLKHTNRQKADRGGAQSMSRIGASEGKTIKRKAKVCSPLWPRLECESLR
jgi:hypothetical protein